jgi:phosphoenolpyruvate carboxykinase (GTP)
MDGTATAMETPLGYTPTIDALDCSGLDISTDQLEKVLRVDVEEWKAEIPLIQEWFESMGEKLPAVLWTELDGLKARLGL